MKKTVLALATALVCSSAFAHDIEAGEAYAYPTVQGMTQGGAFVNLTNTEKKDDKLASATASKDFADKIELHTHVNDNGVMRMREVKGGIPLPKKAVTELKPGSYHVMFMGLKQPLKEGETVPVTLKFKKAKPITIDVPVKNVPKAADGAHNHGGGAHAH